MSTPVPVAGHPGNDRAPGVAGTGQPPHRTPRVPRRRRPWLVVLAVMLVVGAALGNYAMYAARDTRVPVLVLARDVEWGQSITEEDLAVALAVADPYAHMVRVGDRTKVIGQVAAVRLTAGSVLAPSHVTATTVPGPGQQVVGLLLRPGNLPAMGVRPGDQVEVVPVAGEPAAGSAGVVSTGAAFRARVVGVGERDANGAVTVDVVVPVDRARDATAAAAGRVILTLLGPGR